MGTVLTLLSNADVRATVTDWFDEESDHVTVDAADPASTAFDCCLTDRRSLHRHWEAIRTSKVEADPVIVPCILLLSETTTRRAGADLYTETMRAFPETVDAILGQPLRPFELASTVERLFECRRTSRRLAAVTDRVERFERVTDAMPHAYYVTDSRGTITYVNPGFEHITGYTGEEAIGQTPAILNSGAQDDAYYRDLWATLQAGEIWTEEVINERKNGDRYFADQTIVPIIDDEGRIEWYVAAQTDVTERKNRTRHLEVLDRVLRHNLSNDLNVIMGRAELIAHNAVGELEAQAVVILERSEALVETATKERSIVQTIVEDRTPERQDLVTIVQRLVAETQTRYPDAVIEVTVPDTAPVSASRTLDRAVEELLENAVVHNGADCPNLAITVDRRKTTVAVTVADDGPGIPEADLAILDGNSDIEPLFHGQGLGLWLVNWIVHFSDGAIDVESRDPAGSEITLSLPRPGATTDRQPAIHGS